jgi:EAL domain-containing protein (putative c-di-GMP-specific phosphodiesterase class I)
MPTTVHLPAPLLNAVDRRAKALRISRNRLVVQALEQAVHERSGWSKEFLDRLRDVDPATADDVDRLTTDVKQARRSKKPRAL